jgi:hypothetical protein
MTACGPRTTYVLSRILDHPGIPSRPQEQKEACHFDDLNFDRRQRCYRCRTNGAAPSLTAGRRVRANQKRCPTDKVLMTEE